MELTLVLNQFGEREKSGVWKVTGSVCVLTMVLYRVLNCRGLEMRYVILVNVIF
jgi:hypothetical protein